MADFFENLGKVGIGVIISGAAGLLMNVLLGRFLPGEQYGVYRVFLSSVLMVGGFLSFGVERRTSSFLAKENQSKEIAGKMLSMAFLIIGGLTIFSLVFYNYLSGFLGGNLFFISFIGASIFLILYRYSMGLFKGLRKEKYVGFQNIAIGGLKLILIGLVFSYGFLAAEISAAIIGVYLLMVVISVLWLRNHLSLLKISAPSAHDIKSVIFSTSKQFGEVILLFSAPIIVKLIGGTSTEAGIIGATVTLAIIPYYAYLAVTHVMLPEISNLESKEEYRRIDDRIGLFTWLTLVGIVLWSIIGYFLAPEALLLIFGEGFVINSIQGGLIFAASGLLLIASLYTEVVIGLGQERKLAFIWLAPLLTFSLLLLPGESIALTGLSLLSYVSISTVLLTWEMLKQDIKIFKLNLDQIR